MAKAPEETGVVREKIPMAKHRTKKGPFSVGSMQAILTNGPRAKPVKLRPAPWDTEEADAR